MGVETALIASAVASTIGTGYSIYSGEKQLDLAKKEYNANRAAEAESRKAADEAEIARKKALLAEQQSASAEDKGKSMYKQKGSAYQAEASNWGLGTKNDQLG